MKLTQELTLHQRESLAKAFDDLALEARQGKIVGYAISMVEISGDGELITASIYGGSFEVATLMKGGIEELKADIIKHEFIVTMNLETVDEAEATSEAVH